MGRDPFSKVWLILLFMLHVRTVECAHSAVGLVPDHEVLELSEAGFAGFEQFTHVAPVHADIGNGAIPAARSCRTKAGFKDIFALIILILVLLFRPQGIIGGGERGVEE